MKKKDLALTYEFEYLVSEKLAGILLDSGLSGLELIPTRHKTANPKYAFGVLQVVPSHVFPPMVPPTEFEKSKEYCETCGKRGLFLRSEPHYQRAHLTEVRDFNYTFEYFGEGRFPSRQIIISSRVYDILLTQKIRGFRVEPVRLL